MNKYLKILIINTILLTSFILNIKTNVSYSQDINNMDELISIMRREDDLERVINIHTMKYSPINLLKSFFNMELDICKSSKKTLIRKIRLEKEESLKNSNIKYTKGIWPLENYSYISSPYGYRKHPITKRVSFHNGIDIPAPKNTSVLASDDGIVVFAGYKNGYGNVVEIEHFDNKKTLYAHNNSIVVKVGDVVKKGQIISKVGSTGNSTGNHVHFELRINNKRINPLYGVTRDV